MARKKIIFEKQKIVDTSFHIIKSEGNEAFSARRLATELNISSMTVYNYYKNIDEIKKEVIIKGFNILYKMIFHDMENKKEKLAEEGICCLCRIMALNMMNFALGNKEIYILMFTEYGYKFRKDHEIRLFYNYMPQLANRIKLAQSEAQDLKKRCYIFESTIQRLIMEKLNKLYDYSLEEYNDYIDFSLKHLFRINTEG